MNIPPAAGRALSRHVSRAVARLSPNRYRQEAAYVAALFARLDGVVYQGRSLTLELKSTIVSDRGPHSAESIWGADFGIVASINGTYQDAEKGVLGQAKRGSIITQAAGQIEDFRSQVVKMSRVTNALVGLEVPTSADGLPTIRVLEIPRMEGDIPIQSSPRQYEQLLKPENDDDPAVLIGPAIPLWKYLTTELLRCVHGDRNEKLIRGLDDSSLTSLRIDASTPR